MSQSPPAPPAGPFWAVTSFYNPGSNGHAWAAHRSLLQAHPLFDAWVVGGGDVAFTYAAAGLAADHISMRGLTAAHASHYLQHGDPVDRRYQARFSILARHSFDPGHFLKRSISGVWAWADASDGLQGEIRAYCDQRNEDGAAPSSSPELSMAG